MERNKAVLHAVSVAARLLIICLCVAALVGLVNALTEKRIADDEKARKQDAIKLFFADMTAADEVNAPKIERARAVFAVKKDGQLLGYAVDFVGSSAYGGDVDMMIALGTDGKVKGLQVINHSETFIDRYLDANKAYTGADVSAGATLSYNAIKNAIRDVETAFANISAEAEEEDEETALLSAREEKAAGARRALFPTAETFTPRTGVEKERVNAVYTAADTAGETLGLAVDYTGRGHSGDVWMMLGVSPAGELVGLIVLEHSDGLMDYYIGANNAYNGGAAVAGATASYNAVKNAIDDVLSTDWGWNV